MVRRYLCLLRSLRTNKIVQAFYRKGESEEEIKSRINHFKREDTYWDIQPSAVSQPSKKRSSKLGESHWGPE